MLMFIELRTEYEHLSALNKGGGVNMPVAYWLERSEEAHAKHGGGFDEQGFFCKAFNS